MTAIATPSIAALRADIDQLDAQLLTLMEQRLSLSRAIGAAKAREPDALMLRPDREEQVVEVAGDSRGEAADRPTAP